METSFQPMPPPMLVRKEAVGTALGVCFRRHAIGLSKQTRDWPFGLPIYLLFEVA